MSTNKHSEEKKQNTDRKKDPPPSKKKGGNRFARVCQLMLPNYKVETADTRVLLTCFSLFIYKTFYVLGIFLARRFRYAKRHVRKRFLRMKGSFYWRLQRISTWSAAAFRGIRLSISTPLRRIQEIYRAQKPVIQEERKQHLIPFAAFYPVVKSSGIFLWRIVVVLLNYVAPLVALIVLATTLHMRLNETTVLKLTYEGTELGYIQSENVFDQAVSLVQERFANTQQFKIPVPTFNLEKISEERAVFLLSSEDIADTIIRESGSEIELAFGLWVNNRFLGAVQDKDALFDEFDRILAGSSMGLPDEEVKFSKNIRVTKAIYPVSSIVDLGALFAILNGQDQAEEIYIVQDGDTPIEIAEKNGMRYQDLLRLNPTIEEDLKPGYELKTKVARPFLPTRNTYIEEYEQVIPYEVVEVENATYARGYEKVTQEGEDGLRMILAEVTIENGDEISRTILNEDDDHAIIRHPIDERIVIGINDPKKMPAATTPPAAQTTPDTTAKQPSTDMTPASAGSSGFIWPTNGGHATTYPNHSGNGVDIARPPGTPVYASAGGVVTKVVNGWTGYGHYVMIDHGNGYVTLYGHNSAIYVQPGERVEQGQVISAIGQTGNATGPHVHFEVRYNGQGLYPTQFIGTTG